MIEVRIDSLGRDGAGRAAGLTAPFALPGERVRGTASEGELAVSELVEASEHRAAPPCRHFGLCGGCALQHASDPLLAAWKREVVVRALAGQGVDAPVTVAHVSPPATRRRAVFAGRRTKKGALVGFHAWRSETVVDLAECHVARPDVFAALPALRAITRAGASRSGALRLTVTASEAGLDLHVGGGKPLDGPLAAELAALAAEHDLARLAWGAEIVAARRPPAQRFGRARVVPPPGAFLQATAEGEAALLAAVAEAIGPAARVADLFAGCGTFALPLAERAEVLAVEGEAASVAALDAAWRGTPGLKPVASEARDLFRRPLLPAELARIDAVVIDPPRAGAEAQMRVLAAARPGIVAAVSCNPVSFARDARILAAGGFRLDWVRVIDQFRWSPHVELAARFSR